MGKIKKIMPLFILFMILGFKTCAEEKVIEENDTNANEVISENEYVSSNVNAIQAGALLTEEIEAGKFRTSIEGVDIPGGVREVKFAVWSELYGQDDIKWYSALKNNTLYTYNWNIANHRGLGNYNVHAYAINARGEYIVLGKSDFMIGQPQVSDIIVKEDIEAGTAQLNFLEKSNSLLVKNIQAAVWSEENGQDDIQWYTISGNQQQGYTKLIDIRNHKFSLGKYYVHVYITDITGELYFTGDSSFALNAKNGTVSVEKKNSTEYEMILSDVVVPGGINEVFIPIWSEVNGQDDIKWYNAIKEADGTFHSIFSIKNHRGLGKFNIHAYVVTNGGANICVSKAKMDIDKPLSSNITIPDSDYSVDKGTFKIWISDITNTELLDNVQVPVWNGENGQDDIIWYKAKKDSNSRYYVEVNIKSHNYAMGKYFAHVYMRDVTGDLYCIGKETKEVNPEKGDLSITKNSEKEYTVKLRNVKIPGGIKGVQFPTWSSVNGQDDIQWYTAEKNSAGEYSYKVSVKKHKGLGAFSVHAYAILPNNALVSLGKTGFETLAPDIEEVKVNDTDREKGEFQVTVFGIKNDELIQDIQVPVWSEQGQGDIVWYKAVKNSAGDYVVKINIKNHKYNCSEYKIHVYMTDITGIMSRVGQTICKFYPEFKSLEAADKDGTETTYNIDLQGLKVPAGEKSVEFAVWGAEKGQNDIKWYSANKTENGAYSYQVNIRNHKELGKYFVHAYFISKDNTPQYIGATEFTLNHIPTISEVAASEINGTVGSFKVTVRGVMAPSGVSQVQIPVWCAENQSDIVWYNANRISEGVYVANVSVSKHANHFGTYKIHAYVTMGNGILCKVGNATTVIQPKNYVYSNYVNATQREVVILGATANRVLFPTWSEANGQDDIQWYEGINSGNGKWSTIIDSGNHNSGGNYTTHIYTVVNNVTNKVNQCSYSLQWIPSEQRLMTARANLYSSQTPYLLLVNRSTHKVAVFQGWQGNWNCIQLWDCSDGTHNTPTVEGIFKVGIRGYYFDSGASRCYWYTQFKGNYLFHSVLYNKNGTLQDGRLGMALSHGCVRLKIENAKWIYDTIPSGSTVVVYH